jgi:subtilisin family serine protease
MKTAAADAQAPVISSLDSMDVTVQQQFWIVNAVLVETGNGVSQADLQSVSGVERVYENAEYQQPGPAGDDSTGEISVDNNHEYTYGLRQIGVPSFDDTYNTTGQGTDVAILDDGVSDPDNLHPDLDFATKAIAENGEVTTGTLGSPDNGHGEHVAGTAVGSLEPAGDVPRYSVAPGANLHKINVFQGGAFTSDLVAAVQFSASNGYDVASMSLGFPALDGLSTIQPPMERAMQNADDLGAIVVGSAGNSGSGAAGGPVTSPGAEFSGFSIGASNNARDIAAFSSGAVVTPNNAVVFENSTYSDRVPYPDTYPREFIKPDVSAPGVGVLSAGPLGTNVASNPTYSTSSGTSMAAPHVAGAVALVQSATSVEHSPEAIRNALVETAEKPADAPTVTNERDIRYGAGIINVTAATMALQEGTTALSGEVTDASTGDGLTGAKLTTDTNVVTSTENGNYSTQVTADTPNVTVTADEFGYTAETQTVDNDGAATADFALSPEVAVDPVVGQPTFTTFQSNFSIVADVRNLEEYTVELVDATGVSEADLSVSVAGNAATFGQPLALGGVSADDVPVTVEVDGQFNEGDEFSLEHTFAGPGDDVVVTTGPTTLTETIGPPAFELSNFTAPDGQALGQAEPYAAAVTITNTGQQTGTATAEWFLGPLGVAGSNPTANLAPGESQRVSLNFGDINVGAFFSGLPVGLVQGFEATPANPDGSGDVTVKTFDVGSGAFSLFDPFGAERVGETATVFDGSVSMTDQQFEDSTSEITVDTSDLQPAGASDYVIVVHNQTGVPAGGVGPPIGFSGNLTGAETNVTVPLTEEITQTTPLLAMIHFPGNPAGTPIPTFSSGAFGISDGQAGTVTDTAEMSIFSAEGAALDFGSQALGVDGQGNAVVYVDNITEAEQVEQTDVTNPADDFVVLFEGEQQVASNVVDFAPIADAQNGELTLEAENTNPGTHTVEIFANVSSEFDPTDGSQSTQTGGPQSAQAADQLADASGETTVILLVDRNIERSLITSGEVSSAELQRDSELTMQPVKSQINQLAAAEIQREYWVGNAMSVEIDLDQSDLSALTGIPGVSSVVPNVQLELPPQPTLETGAGSDELGTDGITPGLEPGNFTYGLQKIGIPSFEQQFETDGEGATVAIIDDGISNPEAGHPDLDIAQRAIAVDGSITEGTLGSPGAHGEHVAGTATGAADPAGEIPRYGVAPNASLIKVNAFEGGAFLDDILAGVQYSVAQDADVAGMSLGFPPTNDRNPMINAVDRAMKDANAAGTLVSVSAGNSGNFDQGGPVTSPAPEFGAFSVGASFDNPVNVPEIPASIIPSNTGSNNDIVFFSSGGVISERTAVESFEYPDTYPRQYVQPDVSAPGAIVISAGPLGSTPPSLSDDAATYSYSSGTSMAQPHVAGAVALVQSATSEDLGPKQIEAALVETAEKPADASELFRSIGNRDIRYGTGIINVTAAALAAQTENLAVSGTVSGPGGEAVVGATVESADGSLTNTDENGTFTLQTTAPDTSITVDAFGFEPATVNVSASGATSDQVQISEDVQLDRDLEVVPADPPTGVIGDSFDISVDVGSLESFTLELSDTADVTASEINVSSNLGPVSLGETLNFSNLTGTIVLTVDLTADVDLGDRITFEHSFTGVGDEITVTTSTLSVPPLDQPRGAAETANVLAADVAIDNQSFEGSTSEVTVSTSSVLPDDEEYVIVVHNVTDGGLPIVGNSGVLTGAQDNVTIPIDTLETTTDVLAMLHFAEGGTFVAPITAFDPAAGAPVPVTDTAIVEIEQTGNFTVNGLSPQSATVNKSETFDVSATVENVGDTQGTQPVELRLEPDGAAVASQSVQLAPGENTTVSFENVSVGTPGVYNHTVASSDDRATGDLTVQSLANFEVSNLSAPAAADNNEQITVNATISNTGDQAGTQDVLFQLDGDGNFDSPAVSVVAAENLTLAGGASQQAEITVETPSENGVFEHGLFTNDDNQTAEITVGNPQVVASLSDESGAVGENVTSAFTIDGFDGQEDVSGYDVEIEFDPSVIEFVQVTEVDTTRVIVNDEDVDNGVLGLTFVTATPVSTPLTAVEIEFTVVGSGDSSLTLNETISDVQGPGGAALNPVFEDGSVSSTGSTALNSATVWTAPPV